MTGEQADFGMGRGPGLQAGTMGSKYQAVEPLGCDVELGIGWQGVCAVEKPSVVVLDRDPAVSAGMTEEGHEVHLGGKGKMDGFESEPLGIGLFVQYPRRLVSEVRPIVGQIDPCARAAHRFNLSPVYVHLSVREVWQAAGMVKVQMGHDDVPDVFGGAAEASDLTDGGALRVIATAEVESEEANLRRRVGVVMQPQAGIYEHRAMIGVHEKAGAAYVPAREPRGHRRAVKNADWHGGFLVGDLVARPFELSGLTHWAERCSRVSEDIHEASLTQSDRLFQCKRRTNDPSHHRGRV